MTITTLFIADSGTFDRSMNLHVPRVGRDPFTQTPITITGPRWDEAVLASLPRVVVQGLDSRVVALAFDVGAVEELARGEAPGITEGAREAFSFPRVYKLPAAATLAATSESPEQSASRLDVFLERLGELDLHGGFGLEASEALGPWSPDSFPDAETELFEALKRLATLGDASTALYGIVED